MREIVLDTETTGLDPDAGHRVVEIGCLELVNCVPSGRTFHCYLNPEREMPADAHAVHGLSSEFLAAQLRFAEVVEDFLAFIADDPLVIHNAPFDLGFLNAELARLDRAPLAAERAVDTLLLARRRFPGAPASLDALCRRFDVDLSARELHGALLDARLLAEVYMHLSGGRQPGLDLTATCGAETVAPVLAARPPRPARPHQPSADELARHRAFVETLDDPLWRR